MPELNVLCAALPEYETPALEQQWQVEGLRVMQDLGVHGVACSMGIATRRLLFKVIRAAAYEQILDIGTYVGVSALNFALAVGATGRVVTVDIELNQWRRARLPQDPAALWQMGGVAARVESVLQDSRAYLRATERQFDLISIDGWHEDACVYAEIGLALKRLRPGGILFLDDVQPPDYVPNTGCDKIDGPWRAVQWALAQWPRLRMIQPPGVPAVAFLVANGGA